MDQAGAGQVACVDVQVAQMINQRSAFVAQWIVFGSGDQSRRQGGRRANEAPRAVVLDSVETARPRIPAGYQYAVRAPTTIAGRRAGGTLSRRTHQCEVRPCGVRLLFSDLGQPLP